MAKLEPRVPNDGRLFAARHLSFVVPPEVEDEGEVHTARKKRRVHARTRRRVNLRHSHPHRAVPVFCGCEESHYLWIQNGGVPGTIWIRLSASLLFNVRLGAARRPRAGFGVALCPELYLHRGFCGLQQPGADCSARTPPSPDRFPVSTAHPVSTPGSSAYLLTGP